MGERRREGTLIKKIPLANAGITATHLLNEKVADFLEQHYYPHGHVVVLGGDPDQTHCVEQRDQERLHRAELNPLYVVQVALEGHQVQVNVLSFGQSCVKRWEKWQDPPSWGALGYELDAGLTSPDRKVPGKTNAPDEHKARSPTCVMKIAHP